MAGCDEERQSTDGPVCEQLHVASYWNGVWREEDCADLAQEINDADDEGAVRGVDSHDEGVVHDSLPRQERRVRPQRLHQRSVRGRLHLWQQDISQIKDGFETF